MLLLLGAWLALAIPAYAAGAALFPVGTLERPGDRALLATWLGLVLLALSLLALSAATPLTPSASAIFLGGITILSLCTRRAREELRVLLSAITPAMFVAGAVLMLAVAAIGSGRKPWGDVGLYYAQSIRWLSHLGAVPGLALIHYRFGTMSSWFALAAPFDHGPFESSADPVPDGLVLLLAALQLIIVLARLVRGRARMPDRFLLVALIWLLPFLDSKLAVSASADAPVALIAVLTVWLILSLEDGKHDAERASGIDPFVMPVVLGAGAVAVKLSALPILFVAFAWYVVRRRAEPRRLLLGTVVTAGVLLPYLAVNAVLSGCVLYPSRVLCLPVPWSLADAGASYNALMQGGTQLNGASTQGRSILAAVLTFMQTHNTIVTLIAISLACAVALVRAPRHQHARAILWAIALFAAGSLFVIIGAPEKRFIMGYCAIVPPLLVAVRGEALFDRGRMWLARWPRAAGALALVLPAALLAVALTIRYPVINLGTVLHDRSLRRVIDTTRLGLHAPPPLTADVQVESRTANDVRYTVPVYRDRCWAAPLPCTPGLTTPDIRLRKPARGLRGGFELVRVGGPDDAVAGSQVEPLGGR